MAKAAVPGLVRTHGPDDRPGLISRPEAAGGPGGAEVEQAAYGRPGSAVSEADCEYTVRGCGPPCGDWLRAMRMDSGEGCSGR